MAKEKYGDSRTFEPNFKGPIHNRSCTDVFCCLLFILALLGYIAVTALAWSQGDPQKAIYPKDSRGQLCGQKGTPLEKKPLLFYFNIMECARTKVLQDLQCLTTQICVEKCPGRFLTRKEVKRTYTEHIPYYSQFCKEGVNTTLVTPEVLKHGKCPEWIINSKPFMHRCLPDLKKMENEGVIVIANKTTFTSGDVNLNVTDLLEATKKSNIIVEAQEVAMRIFEDYIKSWHWILLGLVIAMVLSLLFIFLLRFLAGVIIWVIIISVILVIGYGTFQCYMQCVKGQAESGQAESDLIIKDLGLQEGFSIYLQIPQTWLAFTIILGIVELVIILLLIFLRKRIIVAIALIKEASRVLTHMMSSLFYPLLTFALVSLAIAYWAVTAVYLSTSNEPVYKVFNITECEYSRQTCKPETFNSSKVLTQCPDAECLFAFYGGETYFHKYLIVFQLYNMWMFSWCVNFVTALGQVTLAGAFASYYWAFNKPDDIPTFPVFSSLGRALRYHTGSLAFGSLVLSINQVIIMILEYLEKKLKVATNRVAKFIMRCLKCCFWCLENSIKFLNSNAYITIAIYGKNFCTSTKDASCLLMRNIVRVAKLDKVTDFLLFLGKELIVGIVGVCSYFFFTGKIKAVEEVTPPLNYRWVPIMTVMIGAYIIAHGFFSVYGMCVDTLFLCFLEDLERNDGSAERPYFMSKSLQKILNKKNKVMSE
ncbi:choline transporter-like protein 2 [Colossoma macropomum]|uniref:choline transporter-like protein 2 n=1 Tax=Colossoma macropomum TaxID=42526 RepID=UPI0018644EE6|nr:choline transporter-like protein 2 [Colossoma macropomum]